MPSFLYGGIPGKGVEDAIAPILVKEMTGGIVGTLDLDKAFDRTSPELACKVFRHLGMPSHTAALLQHTWTNQNRFLQYQGEILKQPCLVGNSLPQGDCWSMLAMCMVLLPIGNRIERQFPATTQAIYADDRSFVSPEPLEALKVRDMWHENTAKIGLKESVGKEQFFHRNKPNRRKLVKLGLPAASLEDATCILGFNFMPAQRRKAVGKEVSRKHTAKVKARKCRCLPGGGARQQRMARMTVPTVAGWGLVCRQPTRAEAHDFFQLAKTFHTWPKQSSVPLLKIVTGHNWDLHLASASTCLRVLTRYVIRTGRALPAWPHARSGWNGSLRIAMENVGLTEVGPWEWTHDRVGTIKIHPNALRPMNDPNGFLQHRLRDAWRFSNFEEWRQSNQRDAAECVDVRITAEHFAALKKVNLNADSLACLTGAFVSPKAYEVMSGSPQCCPFCSGSECTLEHVVWLCYQNPFRKDGLAPMSIIQKRLGWPEGRDAEHDLQVISCLASSRAACLRARRGHD